MEIGSASSLGKQQQMGELKHKVDNSQSNPEQEHHVLEERKYSKQELEKEISGLNKWIQTTNTHLKFTLHEKLNEYYIQVVNDQTNEVVREIPSKKVMDMVAKMQEMIGLLVDEKR